MGLSLVRYALPDAAAPAWGELRADGIHPLGLDCDSHREVMARFFADPDAFRGASAGSTIDPATVRYLSPVTGGVQLFCQGLNYAEHRAESGAALGAGEESLLFMKATSSICGPDDTILRPAGCLLLDYEIELALVLKRDIIAAVTIRDTALPDYVGALVLCNDVSARDLMFGAAMLQWFRGKSQRTFCPMGPVLYLMEPADFARLFSLQLELRWNGELRQSASTAQLIHRPAETLSDISRWADMRAGDCLLTGTPGGVLAGSSLKVGLAILGNFRNDRKRREKFTAAQLARTRFLEPGDRLELSIRSTDGVIDLGTQRNTIADAGA